MHKPNELIAAALQPLNSGLAKAVYYCWQPPFNRPCHRYTFCPSCSRLRERRLRRKYARLLGQMRNPIFITLTAHTQQTLTRGNLIWIRNRFKSFRRWRRFQRSVAGGIYSIEIKLSSRSGQWNIHAHLLVDLAEWSLSKNALRQAWHERTGAFIVDLRPIETLTQSRVLYYMNKNQELPAGTPADEAISTLAQQTAIPPDPHRLRELYHAIRGFRRSQTFGNLHKRAGMPVPGQRNFERDQAPSLIRRNMREK